MVVPSKFSHVVYRTRRFEEMIEWYQKVFEATVQHRDSVLAFLTYDEEHHRFAFVNLAAKNPEGDETDRKGKIGVDHVAYTYASLGDLLSTYSRLKGHGITPFWPVHHGITLSFYYADPDGNRMEFQVECFPTIEQANAYMQSESFAANPIGVRIDPDALVEQYGQGIPTKELLQMPDRPAA